MTTIFTFSDSHNREIEPRLFSVMCESDYIFFLGDGLSGVVQKLGADTDKLRAVKGNCDGFTYPEERVVEVEGVRFLLVHGHRYHGKLDLLYAAKERNCNCVLYGHTHVFEDITEEGVRLINVGSLSSSPTDDIGYVFIVVCGEKIFVNFVKTA